MLAEKPQVFSVQNKHHFQPLTRFPSPLASQQGQLDVVHACALSGPQLVLWPQLCVVSGIWVMVGSLNAPCSPGWMGVKDCPPLFLFKGLFHFLKLEGEERGGNKRPLFLSLSVCVPRAFFSHTSLLSVFCLSLS